MPRAEGESCGGSSVALRVHGVGLGLGLTGLLLEAHGLGGLGGLLLPAVLLVGRRGGIGAGAVLLGLLLGGACALLGVGLGLAAVRLGLLLALLGGDLVLQAGAGLLPPPALRPRLRLEGP